MTSQKDKSVSIRVQVPDSLRNKLKGKAGLEGRTMSEVVEELIEKYVKDLPDQNQPKSS